MTKLAAINYQRHGGKRWLSFGSDFGFAAQTAVVPLVVRELPKATMAFPIGFIREGKTLGPAAIMSLETKHNLFVAADGRWLGGYQPAALRSFPFRLIKTKSGEFALCIDEESGLITDSKDGEPFFEGREISAGLKQVLDFLTQFEQNKVATERACVALERHDVIKPWTITIKAGKEEKRIEGIYRIDEAALKALPMESYDDLRQSNALLIAYCQLLSMQHLPELGRLTDAYAAQHQETEVILHQSLRSRDAELINIDWSLFSNDSHEKGST